MTQHLCPTGTHREPHYSCYNNHGCRCDGCTELHASDYRRRLRRRERTTRCPNCGGPGGLYADATCGPCYEYRARNGVDRPPEVYDPDPRSCDNCGRVMESGEPLRNGECEACARYRYRNGEPRPERLWSLEDATSWMPQEVAS